MFIYLLIYSLGGKLYCRHLDVVAAGVLVNVEGAVPPLLVTDLALALYHQVPHRVTVHDEVPDLRREFDAAISRPLCKNNDKKIKIFTDDQK